MACPYLRHDVREELENGEVEDMTDRVHKSLTATDAVSSDGYGESPGHVRGSRDEPETLTYTDYLKIEDLLRCCQPVTDVHDEHLFIIVHQVYELWFKEILHELDSVRGLFQQPKVDERDMLKVNSRLSRVVHILKILVDQIMILETMNPSDFGQFRDKLKNSSGFQSVQFRLLENKLGTSKESRIRYNNVDYSMTFKDMPKYRRLIEESEKQPSVFDLVQMWLERTPGLESDGFNFWEKYRVSCRRWLEDEKLNIEKIQDLNQRSNKLEALKKNQENFDQILIEENYERSRMRGDRRFTWKAIQGALMISFYCDEVVFHQPFRMLTLLMDIDSLITKWRYNHVMLVQRQLGTKLGSGGSSGYQYLRSTVSDRYKVFLDLFNLSNYLIPKQYITPLSRQFRSRLITVCMPSFVDLEGADSGGEYTVSDSK